MHARHNHMNKKPLLTVAIPTYNRSKTLEKIINQLRKEKNESFLILISDDASPDNGETEAMVRKYQKIMQNLIYNKNKTNLGFSGNVCKLYELAQTKYVWFFCDDDTILPGAVNSVLQALIKYDPVVAIFNYTWINPYGEKLLAGPQKDIVYDDINQLTDYQPLMRLTFLSITVIEKRLSIEPIKRTDYKNNIFFQSTLALFLLSDKFKYCEIASTILHRNVGFKYGEFFKFCLIDQLEAVFAIDHKFDNKKFIRWNKNHLPIAFKLYLSQKLGLFKYNGSPTMGTIKKIMKYYGFYSIFIFSFPMLCAIIPKFLIKFLYLIQLYSIHGYKKGMQVYRKNLNRAFVDTRKTGFTRYR